MNAYILSYSADGSINCSLAILLQGLSKIIKTRIGTNFSSNVNVWTNASIGKPSIAELNLEHRNIAPDDDIVIVDDHTPHGLPHHSPEILAGLIEINRVKPVILIRHHDASNTIKYPDSLSRVFISHCTGSFFKDSRYKPLPIGLSYNLIEEAHRSRDRYQSLGRESRFLVNFGHTISQSVRQALQFSIIAPFSRQFKVEKTNSREEDYRKHLTTSCGIFTYGGEFIWDLDEWYKINSPHLYDSYFGHYCNDVAIVRWDSWRFWEAAAFGCAQVTLDFEAYKLRLPIIPTPWIHYIPVDLEDPKRSLFILQKMLISDPFCLERIGHAMQSFVFEHYNPEAIARWILNESNI
jgi:hypothetical protein